MTWVKVCGVTQADHVTAAVEGGADALGVVCWSESPRNLPPERAGELVEQSPVPVFLVTVDMSPESVLSLAERVGVAGVQPYGCHASAIGADATQAGFEVIMPSHGTDPVPNGQIALIDSGSEIRPGGTGRMLDWEALNVIDERWILAGGLTPYNVAGAIGTTGAWGVDVSSGVEETPGVKSPDLIKRFLREVKYE